MKKSYATDELLKFFATGPRDAANKPSRFPCRICQKDGLVLTHGHYEFSRHFQGCRLFPRDQRLRLETPGWWALDFHGKPLTEDDLEQQQVKIRKDPLVVRDREHPFTEDLIVDEAEVIDPNLPLLTKVTSLVQVLQSGGSYALIAKLWPQFIVLAGNINVEVARNRDEVLVSSVWYPELFCDFPDSHCCLVLSISSWVECRHGFYYVQLDGQRLF